MKPLVVALLVLLALPPASAGWLQDELLEPEKAFEISTRPADERNIEVRFRIADGYYMYRDRFKFETASGEPLGDVELPPGVRKKDPFFGETQTYRREAVIRVPIGPRDVERGRMSLKVTSQGCSDTGVCYVPLEQVIDVRLTDTSFSNTPSPGAPTAWLVNSSFQALLGTAILTLLALALRFAPAAAPWRKRARHTEWVYPALSFGIAAMLVVAAYPVLAPPLTQLAWGAWLVMGGVWLRAIDRLPESVGGTARLAKGVGVLSLAAGVVLLVFAAGLRVNTASTPTQVSAQHAPPSFARVATLQEFDARLRDATLPVMLDFYADWCVSCKEMERFTFSDPAVVQRMRQMQLLQVDVTRNTDGDKAFLKRFGIFGPPAILFFDAQGKELRSLRVIGFQSAERFVAVLDRALGSHAEGQAR